MSLGQHHAILDGNVKRVLSRWLAQEGWPGEKAVETALWQWAERLTPVGGVERYNQAMMDLGASLCSRSQPQCQRCPLQDDCKALALGKPTAFPHPKPKKSVLPVRSTCLLMVQQGRELLLEQRPASVV